ncbi:MAG: hydrolase [Tepidanaerobacteraceae bacterium]
MDKFTLKTDETVLIVIDIQERLVPAMKYGKKVIDNTNILISIAKELEIPIIVTEQYPKGLGKTVPELSSNLEENLPYEKMTFSAYTDEVAATLEKTGRKKIIVAGMETHVCVFQTVRDLIASGYQVYVVQDAVCSRTKDNFKNGISLMSQMGAVVTNTETVLFDLIKISGTPKFKKLSKLIK